MVKNGWNYLYEVIIIIVNIYILLLCFSNSFIKANHETSVNKSINIVNTKQWSWWGLLSRKLFEKKS